MDKEIKDQTKLGEVIKTNGAFVIQFDMVGLGIGVIPGSFVLSTYKGGSPKMLPLTSPNQLEIVFKKFIILI